MAEHITRFSKLKDDNVVKPKDKIDWIVKDNRVGKYTLKGRRFILKNEDNFKHPKDLPEDKWG